MAKVRQKKRKRMRLKMSWVGRLFVCLLLCSRFVGVVCSHVFLVLSSFFCGPSLTNKKTQGTFTWPDGAVYQGDFVNGQRHGQGKYTFSDGGCYEGSWKDGRYDGYGTCVWEDGRKYQGEWKQGMAHGHGVETYSNGTVRHEGLWQDDEPVR